MADKSGYFSLDGAVNYNRFLRHFRQQAEGKNKSHIFNTPRNGLKRAKNGKSLVLVDLADQSDISSNNGGDKPKIEVVDPNEAERRRALSELKVTENQSRDPPSVKNGGGKKKPYSTADNRRNKRSAQSSTGGKIRSKISRTKDIFD